MMFLANIITDTNLIPPKGFNITSSLSDAIPNIPTLIIGYNNINKLYPDFNIKNSHVQDNIYWIFKKNENRDKHIEGLDKFINKVYIDLTQNIKYVFVDPILLSLSNIKKIIRKLKSLENKITYVYNDMIYIYDENLIFGIDLRLLKYMSINVFKLKERIKTDSCVFLEGENIFNEYNDIIDRLDGQVKYTPFLYCLLYGEKNINSIIHLP